MSIIGKYYIWENVAAAISRYWNNEMQTWTTDAHKASFFETEIEARAAAVNAFMRTKAEVLVLQAKKELTPRQPAPLDFVDSIDMMERTGGSFARAIAQAYHCADFINRKRLFNAFPDLFESYAKQYMEWKESKHE